MLFGNDLSVHLLEHVLKIEQIQYFVLSPAMSVLVSLVGGR